MGIKSEVCGQFCISILFLIFKIIIINKHWKGEYNNNIFSPKFSTQNLISPKTLFLKNEILS
jgi:hypothetical protein